MISSVLTPAMYGLNVGTRIMSALADAPAPAPAPAPEPAPQQPCCDIDFSRIDTPEKAALMPALNPTALVAVAAGVAASLGGSQTSQVAVQFLLGANTPASFNVTVSQNSQFPSVDVKGKLGTADFSERWTVDEKNQALHIDGTIGSSTEQLVVTADPRAQIAHIDGKIGDVDVHQTLSMVGKDDQAFLRADGSLGSVAFRQEIRPNMQDRRNPSLSVSGNVGDKPIQSTIRVSQADKNTIIVHGEGSIAGNAIKVDSQYQSKGRFGL